MDKRLEQALDYSNFRLILSTRQKNLKLLMKNKLTLNYEGGIFEVEKDLISFLFVLVSSEVKEFIFIDKNDIPILVEDTSDFLTKVIKLYGSVMNNYYKNYQKLSEAREIRKAVNWDEKKE
jgi:hypothetical protein